MNYDENNNIIDDFSDDIETITWDEPIFTSTNNTSDFSQETINNIQSQIVSPFGDKVEVQEPTITDLNQKDMEREVNNIPQTDLPQEVESPIVSSFENVGLYGVNTDMEDYSNNSITDDLEKTNYIQQPILTQENDITVENLNENNSFQNQINQNEYIEEQKVVTNNEENGKSGLVFIIILFLILIGFVISLPYITKLF